MNKNSQTIVTNFPFVPTLRVLMQTLLLLCLLSLNAHAKETRLALVIGNANYTSMGRLPNPKNDANDIAQALQEVGFKVISGTNLGKKAMTAKIREFDQMLRNSDKDNTIGLFYYAGHGMEVEGKNYLVPVDAAMEYQEDAREEGIPLDRVISRMKYSKNRMNIVVLDACRNNPLPKQDRDLSSGGWSALNNLADGMFIAYGTAPGRKAADGTGRNGLFTKYILKNLKTPGKTLEQVFKATRLGVKQESKGKQITWQNNATTGDFYFVPPNTLASTQTSSKPPSKIPSNFSIYNRPRPAAGNTYKDCPECPVMVVIPAGTFQMGSSNEYDSEKSTHKVTIKQFAMSQTEVTFNQWDACYNAGGCSHKPDDKGWGRGNRPVINVSWNDTKEYIKWLNKKTGKHYRLPSEAEWEYAARAGSTTKYSKYSWGNNISCDKARYDGGENSSCYYEPNGSYRGTALVKSFAANKFGLYDMHGNVYEWVEDKYHDNYKGAPSNGSAWTSGSWSYRMLRGGSWSSNADYLRSASRNYGSHTYRISPIGFRLAQDK